MFDLTSDLNTSNLPDLALLEIHRYVDDGERVPTSCACENWGKLFETLLLYGAKEE
jgi:hypothetical protein